MPIKIEINNSSSYEYLIHGQDLHLKFHIPYSLFSIVFYKQTHTRLWFHKFLTGVYYISPIIYLVNFLIDKKVPFFKNKKKINTIFDYPGKSYKFNVKRNSIWDYRLKLKTGIGTINTFANRQNPKFIFIGIGLGIYIKKLTLNINFVDIKEENIDEPVKINQPTLINHLYQNTYYANDMNLNIINNKIEIDKSNLEIKISSLNYFIDEIQLTREIVN